MAQSTKIVPTVEHSPVPWVVAPNLDIVTPECVLTPDGEKYFRVATVMQDTLLTPHKANAEFIVRACNSHDELLNAAKELIAAYDYNPQVIAGYICGLEKAVKNAEGKI